MASPDEHKLTFLRGSGFLHSLVGVWDLMADASGQWPLQKGFVIFKETKIIAVIERNEDMRRGIEGTYAVEGNRIIITGLFIDTAPERGTLGDGEFEIDGDMLTVTWLLPHQTCQTPHHVEHFDAAPHSPMERSCHKWLSTNQTRQTPQHVDKFRHRSSDTQDTVRGCRGDLSSWNR